MNDIDENAVKAKVDKTYCENIITEFKPFIMHVANRVTGNYISYSDDRWSVSLYAFYEAIQSYTIDKGRFLPFAELVIKRRLYDHMKKQLRRSREISVNPASFDGDSGEDEETTLRRQILKQTILSKSESAKYELEALSQVVKEYGFELFDLTLASPKTEKTKVVCAQAVLFVLNEPDLLNRLRQARTLPLKSLERSLKLPRKVLERHRKYIVTAIEILDGSYPILSEYLKFIREVQQNDGDYHRH